MKKLCYRILCLSFFLLLPLSAFAWEHSIEVGCGTSHDPNHTHYRNSGCLVNSDFAFLGRTPRTQWNLNGGIGQWYTTTPVHKNLTTAALAVALRYYFLDLETVYPAYLLASFGPAYLSSRQFGYNKQGSTIAFQSNAGFGMEFNSVDLNLRLVHYSNAYLASPNQGYNILYLLSVGYLF